MKLRLTHLLPTLSLAIAASAASADTLVFDNLSAGMGSFPGTAAYGSQSHTFVGGAYDVSSGTIQITGFEVVVFNITDAAFSNLKINIFVWGSVNTDIVSPATPAFNNLLGSYSFIANRSVGPYGSALTYGSSPGVPGLALSEALTISTTRLGVSVNIEGTADGVTYGSQAGLTTLITYGVPATTGGLVFNGYYGNSNGEGDGNFTSELETAGFDRSYQSVGIRIYGNVSTVPEPETWALMAIGFVGLLVRRIHAT